MDKRRCQLSELQPKFLQITKSNVERHETDAAATAHGVIFCCPKCLGGLHEHSIVCWFAERDVPDDEIPSDRRWIAEGTSYGDLTVHGPITVRGGCRWSGRIRTGVVSTEPS
jgi:hypothetical protein